jgi:sarcosine oxidase, subunit gamma
MPEMHLPLARRLALGESDGGREEPAHDGAVLIGALPPRARFSLRLDAAGLQRVRVLAGCALDLPVNRCQIAGGRQCLRLGPDEWLLCGEEKDAVEIARDAEAALRGSTHALVDLSHAFVALAVSGAGAAGAINSGCPLALTVAAFPPWSATRTLLGKAEIILARWGDGSFEVLCQRSLAAYVRAFLGQAALAGQGLRVAGGPTLA